MIYVFLAEGMVQYVSKNQLMIVN